MGEPKKIDVNDLPLKEQERIHEYMEMMGEEELPEIYVVDIEMHITDYDIIPIQLLEEALNVAIKEDRFEDAAKLRDVIKKRGYIIDISEKNVTLTHEKK